MNLRKNAQGKPCMIRIPQVCNFNAETTVLCHFRMSGISGMGIKVPDLLGAWGCSACHDVVDRRQYLKHLTLVEIRLLFMEGVMRTIARLIDEGAIKW